jgi:hypothetical protein
LPRQSVPALMAVRRLLTSVMCGGLGARLAHAESAQEGVTVILPALVTNDLAEELSDHVASQCQVPLATCQLLVVSRAVALSL